MGVKAVPDGYHTVTPYLVVRGAGDCLDFIREAFGGREKLRMARPDGSIGHASSLREPEDQFYGDRMAGVRDPAGNCWWIATHVEDVPEDELAARAEQWAQQGASV